MQRAPQDSKPISQGFRPGGDRVAQRLTPRTLPCQNPSTVAVSYSDGAVLTFLFPRTIRITDLNAAISRAGRVRKVILWDEMPGDGRSQRKVTIG